MNEKKSRERIAKMAKEQQDGVVGMNIDALHRALGDDFPEMPPSMEFYSQAKGAGALFFFVHYLRILILKKKIPVCFPFLFLCLKNRQVAVVVLEWSLVAWEE